VRIETVRVFQLEAKLPRPQGNASGFFDRRTALLLQLVAGSGLTGWGETWFMAEAAGEILRRDFLPRALGRDPSRWPSVFETLRQEIGFDRRRAAYAALSALDVAMWDLRARAEGVPVSSLFGGPLREQVRAYASGPFLRPGPDPYDGFGAEIEGYLQEGFTALKLRAGTRPARDAAALADARRRVGPDVALAVDLNQGFGRAGALAAIEAMAPAGLLWAEEPVAPDEFEAYASLAAATAVPIAGGEVLAGAREFGRFMQQGRPAVAQPDLAVCGGFTETLRIAAAADALGIAVAPHVWGTAINLHASLHLAALVRGRRLIGAQDLPLFEYDRSPNPLRTLAPEPPIGPDGAVPVPDSPGLGLDIAPDALAPFLVDRWEGHA